MRRAFTLIELIVVIAIIAIISAIAIPLIMEKRNATSGKNPKIEVQVGEAKYNARKFTLEGHSYFLISHYQAHGFTAVHNPECSKCKPNQVERVEQ
jgi:prepilin-type N-terminal cleavage/methylation domain-containing protein